MYFAVPKTINRKMYEQSLFGLNHGVLSFTVVVLSGLRRHGFGSRVPTSTNKSI